MHPRTDPPDIQWVCCRPGRVILLLCLTALPCLLPAVDGTGVSLPFPRLLAAAGPAGDDHGPKPGPGDGWVAWGCHWDLTDSIFVVQGSMPTAKAYYVSKSFGSFMFEVRMEKLSEDGAIGLLFRYDERRDEGYEVHLWPHGGFAVAKFEGPRKRDFASGPPSHFNKELNTWNTVKVVGEGDRFFVFVNGFHVCTATDRDYERGKLGLLMPGDARQRARFQILKMTEKVDE